MFGNFWQVTNSQAFCRPSRTPIKYVGGCQNYGLFLGTLNIRCRIIIGTQKKTIILTTTHVDDVCVGSSSELLGHCFTHALNPKPETWACTLMLGVNDCYRGWLLRRKPFSKSRTSRALQLCKAVLRVSSRRARAFATLSQQAVEQKHG